MERQEEDLKDTQDWSGNGAEVREALRLLDGESAVGE